jgi:predicted Rossmann fold nucleotide-binding protein DprA/Smf involved in DNA uptake
LGYKFVVDWHLESTARNTKGALDSGRKTIAVIGTVIDSVYSLGSKKLAQQLTENGALVWDFQLASSLS